jgi:peptide chain release factor 2
MKWGLLFDIPRLSNEIEELEQKAAEPGFWDDIEKSQKVLQRTKGLKSKVERFQRLISDWDDLKTLNDLGIEEQDESVILEIG